jgi:hypothetical protein
MQRVWPIIAVADVPRSVRWYEHLLGIPEPSSGDLSFAQVITKVARSAFDRAGV